MSIVGGQEEKNYFFHLVAQKTNIFGLGVCVLRRSVLRRLVLNNELLIQ